MIWMEDKVLYKITTKAYYLDTEVIIVLYRSKYNGEWEESRLKGKPSWFRSEWNNHPDGYMEASYVINGTMHRTNGPAGVVYKKLKNGKFMKVLQNYYLAGKYTGENSQEHKSYVNKIKRLCKKEGVTL